MAMRIGKGNHWDECGFARRLDPEPVGGVPVPRLTTEVARWLSRSELTALEQWAPRFRVQIVKSVAGILPVLARFVVANYVLEDGCPFVAVSRNQLQDVLGWGKGRIDNALHACALTWVQESAPEFVEACRDARAGGVEPLISVIELGNGKVGTSYRLVGIEPAESTTTPLGLPPGGRGPGLTAADAVMAMGRSELAATGPELLAAGPEFACRGADIAGPVPQPTGPGNLGNSGPVVTRSGPGAMGGSAGPSELLPITTSSSLSSAKREEIIGFRQFLAAFGHDAGKRFDETLAAFTGRVRRGWPIDVIVVGARRYHDLPTAPGGGEKWKFPLKFLRDDDHFKAVCGLPKVSHIPWKLENAEVRVTTDHNGRSHLLVGSPRGEMVELPGSIPDAVNLAQVREWACGSGRADVLRQCRLVDAGSDWGM